MTVARLPGRVAGGSTDPWSLSSGQGTRGLLSGRVGQCANPGEGGGDFQLPAAAAAYQAGSGVQYPVAQGLGLGPAQAAVEGDQP